MQKIQVHENGERREVILSGERLEIGRDPENQLVIQDPRSSRRHCRLSLDGDGWWIEDLRSRNGTTLNGAPLGRSRLKAGDEFRIGAARFLFEEDGAPLPAGAAPAPAVEAPVSAPGAERERPSPTVIASGGAPPIELEGLQGAHAGKRLPLSRFPARLGRKKSNTIALEDTRASGSHAEIQARDGRYYLKDLDSRNGTFIDKKRIDEAPLFQGSVIHVGESSFRVHLPPGSGEAPATIDGRRTGGAREIEETEDGADFSRFDAREFLSESGGAGSAIQAAALLLVLGTLLYFAVDVTLRFVRPADPDPSPEGNQIANWSFEAPRDHGSLPAWSIHEGDGASLSTIADGAQFPGKWALSLQSQGQGLARATAASEIAIDPQGEYRVAAQVKNRGAFFCGLLVSWWGESGGQRVEIDRDWGPVIKEDGRSRRLERTVKPPAAAVSARVEPFVVAAGSAGGGASFDQVYFGAAAARPSSGGDDGAGAEDSAEETEWPLELSAQESLPGDGSGGGSPEAGAGSGAGGLGQGLSLRLEGDGSLSEVSRGAKVLIRSFWSGLPPSSDPLALGHRLVVVPRATEEQDGATFAAQIPDLDRGEWAPLEERVQSSGGEIRCEYRFLGAGSGSASSRGALYLWTGPAVRELSAFGPAPSAPISFPPQRPPPGEVEEIIAGSGADQVAILVRPAVTLKSIAAPGSQGRALLVAEAGLDPRAPLLTVRFSRFSRREDEAVKDLFDRAEKLHREGKPGEAQGVIRDLRVRFPWRADDLARAGSLEKTWTEEGEKALQEILDDLPRQKESPVLVLLLARAEKLDLLLARFRGTELEGRIQKAREEIRSLLPPAPLPPAAGIDAAAFLRRTEAHLDRDELGFAALSLELARGADPGEAEKKKIDHLASLLEQRRRQRAEKEVR